jgi:hypothetical protein
MTSWDLLYYLGRANFDKVKNDYLPGGEALEKSNNEGTVRYEYGRVVKAAKEVDEKVEIMYEDISPFKEDGSLPNKVSGHGAKQDHESRPPDRGGWPHLPCGGFSFIRVSSVMRRLRGFGAQYWNPIRLG